MPTNFLPPAPIQDSSNKWRNILGILAILLGIGGAAGWHFIKFSLDRPEARSNFLSEFLPAEKGAIQAGGDLLIEPPVEINKPKLPELAGELLPLEDFSAGSIIVKDHETGAVLYNKNEYEARPIASVTKLMSVLVFLEKEIDLTTTAQVIGADSLDVHMYAGDTYTLQELWDAALIGSSNKAIKTLANALGWPEEAFVERMNQRAQELGMSGTHFADPTGLDDANEATASDVAILLEEALKHPIIQDVLLKKELTLYSNERHKSHHMWSTNWLLLGWIPYNGFELLGGKTGYTSAAGYNFVMQAEGDNGQVINVVILGANTNEARFTEARDIVNSVFESYIWPE